MDWRTLGLTSSCNKSMVSQAPATSTVAMTSHKRMKMDMPYSRAKA